MASSLYTLVPSTQISRKPSSGTYEITELDKAHAVEGATDLAAGAFPGDGCDHRLSAVSDEVRGRDDRCSMNPLAQTARVDLYDS